MSNVKQLGKEKRQTQEEAVNDLTERFRQDGYTIASEPRTTGDGYYESAVFDPEGNYIELLA